MLSVDENKSFNAVVRHISDVGVAACAHVLLTCAAVLLFLIKQAINLFTCPVPVLSEGSHASHGAGSSSPHGQVLVPVCTSGKQGAVVQRWRHDCVSDAPGCASAEL